MSPTTSVLGFRLVSHHAGDNKHVFHLFHLLEPDHCLRLSEPTKHLKASPSVSRVKETTKASYSRDVLFVVLKRIRRYGS